MPAKIEKPTIDENAKLERNRFHTGESARLSYLADIEQKHSPETILNPAYWGNVSGQLRPRDRIEAWCEDGTWFSELVVLEVGRAYVRVWQLTHYKLTTTDVAQSQDARLRGFEVYWRGHHHKFSVKRLSDNEVIHTGEPDRNAANTWVTEHLKALV
jgi:hypothetical protein